MAQQDSLSIMSRGLLVAAVLTLLVSSGAHGFDDQVTHPELTEKAVLASKLDGTQKATLDVARGSAGWLSGDTVLEWLKSGSKQEDAGCRAKSHFHNPWKDFSVSGVSDLDGGNLFCSARGYSNVMWGTDFTASEYPGHDETPNLFNWGHTRAA